MARKFNTFYCTAIVAGLCLFPQDADAGGRKFGLSSFSPGARAASRIRVAPRIKKKARIGMRHVKFPRAAKRIGASRYSIDTGRLGTTKRTDPRLKTLTPKAKKGLVATTKRTTRKKKAVTSTKAIAKKSNPEFRGATLATKAKKSKTAGNPDIKPGIVAKVRVDTDKGGGPKAPHKGEPYVNPRIGLANVVGRGDLNAVPPGVSFGDPTDADGANVAIPLYRYYSDLASNTDASQFPEVWMHLLSSDIEETARTVKWFNPTKGFGFIQPEDVGIHGDSHSTWVNVEPLGVPLLYKPGSGTGSGNPQQSINQVTAIIDGFLPASGGANETRSVGVWGIADGKAAQQKPDGGQTGGNAVAIETLEIAHEGLKMGKSVGSHPDFMWVPQHTADDGSARHPRIPVQSGGAGQTGTVKWFNPSKGFGFIQPEDGGKDAPIRRNNLGLFTLNIGTSEITAGDGSGVAIQFNPESLSRSKKNEARFDGNYFVSKATHASIGSGKTETVGANKIASVQPGRHGGKYEHYDYPGLYEKSADGVGGDAASTGTASNVFAIWVTTGLAGQFPATSETQNNDDTNSVWLRSSQLALSGSMVTGQSGQPDQTNLPFLKQLAARNGYDGK